ncbi:MAG: HAMP domain-containing protein [Actinobacteria bacterium]|nr:MAG: HAMP domain-containing protein [Actinomycetota bacterium]
MTARIRLALLYGLLFLAMGAALLAVSYKLVSHNLPAQRVEAVSGQDVLLRAANLSKFSDLSDSDRAVLSDIATMPPDFALSAAESRKGKLSPSTYEGLTLSLPIHVRRDALHQLLKQSVIVLGLTVLVSVVLGWIVAGRVLRPLTRITDTARRLTSSNLEARINLKGPEDELTRLAAAFDDMLDRLADAFEGQRRFVGNASHELRTPLTIMATELDVTMARPDATIDDLRRMGTTVRVALDRSDRLITSLLALALVEEGLEIERPTDLAMIAAESVERHKARIDEAKLTLTTELTEAIVVGDPGLLDRLTDNLVENAINHNTTNGWIRIRTARAHECAIFEIANSGTVVAEDDIETLFEPFRRLDGAHRSRHSVGLGLSIVRAIARAHGGSAFAQPGQGGGLVITTRIPIAPNED